MEGLAAWAQERAALLAFGPTGWGDEILSGAWLTIRLALATLPVGLALGLPGSACQAQQLDVAARRRPKPSPRSSAACPSC